MNCAILIPTHNRHNYLSRIVKYYSSFKINVYICDSSQEKYQGAMADNIIYVHMPNEDMLMKIIKSLHNITEEYVAFVADDDFVLYSAIEEGYNFLENNQSYKVVTGRFIEFDINFSGTFRNKYQDMYIYWTKINTKFEKSKKQRVRKILEYHYQLVWALHEKNNLLEATTAIQECDLSGRLNWFEPLLSSVCCFNGGVKFLSEIWGVREQLSSIARKKHYKTTLHQSYIGNIIRAKSEDPELFAKELNEVSSCIDKNYFKDFAKMTASYYQAKQRRNIPVMVLSKLFFGHNKELKPEFFKNSSQYNEIKKIYNLINK